MKKVLITGVAKGIGRGIAEHFLKNGYELFGTFYTSESKAQELVKEYGSDRVQLFGPYNFKNLDETEALLGELKNYAFDTVVSNAGMFCDRDEEEVYDDFNNFQLNRYLEKMNCNLFSPTVLLIGLKDNINPGGSIVIISANDAYAGAYSSIAYSVSKSALISLTKCLSQNYGNKNIRVNAVAPGAIDTDMNTPEQMEIAPFFSPTARVGRPEDISAAVFFFGF